MKKALFPLSIPLVTVLFSVAAFMPITANAQTTQTAPVFTLSGMPTIIAAVIANSQTGNSSTNYGANFNIQVTTGSSPVTFGLTNSTQSAFGGIGNTTIWTIYKNGAPDQSTNYNAIPVFAAPNNTTVSSDGTTFTVGANQTAVIPVTLEFAVQNPGHDTYGVRLNGIKWMFAGTNSSQFTAETTWGTVGVGNVPVTPVTPANPITPPTSGSCYQFTHNLGIGSTGADVTALQAWLINNGYAIPLISSGRAPKGYFGPSTALALAKYQAAVGIPPTGFLGTLTQAELDLCRTPPPAPTAPTTPVCPPGYTCAYPTQPVTPIVPPTVPVVPVTLTCPSGYTCTSPMPPIASTTPICPTGYICTPPTSTTTPTAPICPAGYTCNTNPPSIPPVTATTCPANYVCTAAGANSVCPSGYTCTPTTVNCPSGYTCATATVIQTATTLICQSGQTWNGSACAMPISSTLPPVTTQSPIPTVSLTASPNPVAYGSKPTLFWTSTSATSCFAASGNFSTANSVSGSVLNGQNPGSSQTTSTTYAINCQSGTQVVTAQVTVGVQAQTTTPPPATPPAITQTPASASMTASFVGQTSGPAGQNGVFNGSGINDWQFSAALALPSAKTIQSITVVHPNNYDTWSTYNSGNFPLVVFMNGGQQDTSYGQTITLPSGTSDLTLYAAVYTNTSPVGGTVKVTFTDGTTASATITGSAGTNTITHTTNTTSSFIGTPNDAAGYEALRAFCAATDFPGCVAY